MFNVLFWFLFLALLGLISFPVSFCFLPRLGDKGYSFSRVLGLLVWGYSFWLLGSLGFIGNDAAGALISLAILVGVSVLATRKAGWVKITAWARENSRQILMTEGLFLVAFIFMAVIRAANPEATGTEKPMELAFINSLMRSPTLPPHDPWLSGYSISYYYFGYVLVAMLAKITGVSGGVAFNLGITTVFSLTAVGVYGILYSLLSLDQRLRNKARWSAHLAPFFVLIVSNLEGIFHWMHNQGFFWKTNENGEIVSRFWQWMEIERLMLPPETPVTPLADKFWWWWQASRLVRDIDFLGRSKGDVINEFPMFSYILGDLHPHVLALPFAIFIIALALNLILGGANGTTKLFRLKFDISLAYYGLVSLSVGAMAFLNTWDFPIYVGLFVGAYLLYRYRMGEHDLVVLLKDFFGTGLLIGISGVILYLPFYYGFSSQAGGVIPNVIYITRGTHLWLMFAPFFLPLFVYLVRKWMQNTSRSTKLLAMKTTGWLLFSLILISSILLVFAILSGLIPGTADLPGLFLGSVAAPGWREIILEGLLRRVTIPGALVTLLVLITLVFAQLYKRVQPPDTESEETTNSDGEPFVLLLLIIGVLLVLVPEFIYLRDMFGYRINTIFKFYFQAWVLIAIGGAYATLVLWNRLKQAPRIVFQIIMVLLIGSTTIYPILGIASKTNKFSAPENWTLDGAAHIKYASIDEYDAIQMLSEAPIGVVAEAVGHSYSSFGRISVNTGLPGVLGWENHLSQWRGGTEEMGTRNYDLQQLYCAKDWGAASEIIERYDIRYIVIGNLERSAYVLNDSNCPYGLQEGKFIRNMDQIFQQNNIAVYEKRGVSQ